MTACVIDTFAVLSFLFQERGESVASTWMDRGAAISTANAQEVIAKLVDRAVRDGTDADEGLARAVANLKGLVLDSVDLTLDDAVQAGAWAPLQRSHNLRAGNLHCLAVANGWACRSSMPGKRGSRLAEGAGH